MIKTLQFSASFLIILAMAPFAAHAASDSYSTQIEADWAAQERRLNRAPASNEAIAAAAQRAERLLSDLQHSLSSEAIHVHRSKLAQLRAQAASLNALTPEQRLALYHQLRWATRELALSNPLFDSKPIAFLKRHRFICQMLHEYLGYFYDYGDISGGSVCVLEDPGRSFKIRDLVADRLPRGNYTTLAASFDARTLYFGFAERAPEKYDFRSPQRRYFHLYSVQSDGTGLRQLTDGRDDDFDPCPLPDGGLIFMSSRRGGFGRCHNPWEPLPAYTLHRMNADGTDIQTLSWHETNEWHPFVMNDGRIVYIRWDYVDRSAANFHGLWATYPDGSNPVIVFGNYTTRINACYQPHAIPGSDKLAFIAGAHHADVGGSMVMFDPQRVSFQPNGEDHFRSIETLTPEVTFPEANGWPKSYFHAPWPLAENYFLVGFSLDALPGMSSGEQRDTRTGLYYFDRFGNLELLYRDSEASCMYPIPLAPRKVPPVIASTHDPLLGEDGEFILSDVARSFFALPANRPVKELRVYQILPKTHNHVANQPRIGYANAESARMLLGTVPVEPDGSAWFRAPARKPLYFQAVDAQGRALQTMRSAAYLQPGERRGCVGCHETPASVAENRPLLALRRGPSSISPGPEGTRPLSFPLLVQPILDRHCVRCHDGTAGEGKSKLELTGVVKKEFTVAYRNLKPFVRWNEWGGDSLNQTVTLPGRGPADKSPLVKILDDKNHAPELKLADADRRRLYLWLDSNAPFYGSYSQPEQLAQLQGKSIPPPKLQ